MVHQLFKEIIKLSINKNWYRARLEWESIDIFIIPNSEEPMVCLCGHRPIREVNIIRNKNNNETASIGNCCIKHLLGVEQYNLFKSIIKIKKNITKSISFDLLCYIKDNKIFNDWELNFYYSIYKKKKLSEKQYEKKIKLNTYLLKWFKEVDMCDKN